METYTWLYQIQVNGAPVQNGVFESIEDFNMLSVTLSGLHYAPTWRYGASRRDAAGHLTGLRLVATHRRQTLEAMCVRA